MQSLPTVFARFLLLRCFVFCRYVRRVGQSRELGAELFWFAIAGRIPGLRAISKRLWIARDSARFPCNRDPKFTSCIGTWTRLMGITET
ncbi:hypothetical protein VTK56DRAFT_6603 [Thermocarpiscus australiensis]